MNSDMDYEARVKLHILEEDPFPLRTFTVTPANPVHIGRSHSNSKGTDGPSATNAIITSPIVSRLHCELKIGPYSGILRIRDHGSMHGTSVNNDRIAAGEFVNLNDSDLITLGRIQEGSDKKYQCRSFLITYSIHKAKPGATVVDLTSSVQTSVQPVVLPSSVRTMPPGAITPTTSSANRIYQVPDSSSDSGHSENESVMDIVNTANDLKAAIRKRKDERKKSSLVAPVSRSSTPNNQPGNSNEPRLEAHAYGQSCSPSPEPASNQDAQSQFEHDHQAVTSSPIRLDESFPLEDSVEKEMGEVFIRAELDHTDEDVKLNMINDLAMVHPSRRERHLRTRVIEDDEDDDIVPDTFEDDGHGADSSSELNHEFDIIFDAQKEESDYSNYDSHRDEGHEKCQATAIQATGVARGDRSKWFSAEDEVEDATSASFSLPDEDQEASVQAPVNITNQDAENTIDPEDAPATYDLAGMPPYRYSHIDPYTSRPRPYGVNHSTIASPYLTYSSYGSQSGLYENSYAPYGPVSRPNMYPGSTAVYGFGEVYDDRIIAPFDTPGIHTSSSRLWSSDSIIKPRSPAAKPANLTKASISHILSPTALFQAATSTSERKTTSPQSFVDKSRDSRPNTQETAGTVADYQHPLMLYEQQDQKRALMTREEATSQKSATAIDGASSSANKTGIGSTTAAKPVPTWTPVHEINLDRDWAALDLAREELDNATAKAKAEADIAKSSVAKLPMASYISSGSDSESASLRTLSNGIKQQTGCYNGKRTLGAIMPEKKPNILNKSISQAYMEARESAKDVNDNDDESQEPPSPRPIKRLRFSSPPASSPPRSGSPDFFRPTTYDKPAAAKGLRQTEIDDVFRPTTKSAAIKSATDSAKPEKPTATAAPKATTPPITTAIPTSPSSPAQITASARKIATENSIQRIRRARAVIADYKNKEKKRSGFAKTITPFMLGALAGSFGVFGALVGLPESYF